MNFENFIELREGKIRLQVPRIATEKGPGKRGVGYYSKPMSFSRDLTVLILKAQNRKLKVLDGLAATGVRGLRVAKEVACEVTINDHSKAAVKLIELNAKLNDLEVTITNTDLNSILLKNRYDYIDIDPYGSFSEFLDRAFLSINDGGILGITSTDLSNFTGTNKNKELKKYGAVGLRTYLKHEVGIRIMLGYIIKAAAAYNCQAIPLLSVYRGYYYRVFLKLKKNAKLALRFLHQVHTITVRSVVPYTYGPLWIGNLHDPETIKNLRIEEYLDNYNELLKYRDYWLNENRLLFFSLEHLSQRANIDMPKIETVVRILKEKGYAASRTQFDPLGIKTNASFLKMMDILKTVTP